MCGITGIVDTRSDAGCDTEALTRMTDAIAHRGPDASGIWRHRGVGFGHRRLTIIDLDSGQQPMTDSAGHCIVFNGEIYNYVELRAQLETRGHRFHTKSDTEVILAAYREWGKDCQERLNGMWAFAIWDPWKQCVFLSRDRLGEKPLYYAEFGGKLYFGSEIKCLLQAGIPRTPDPTLLEVYLCLSYVPAPHTFFRDIKSLLPGHCLLVHGGNVREHCYWDLPEIDEGDMRCDSASVDEEFAHLLRDSVRIRMRSDVPFGAFLSGGLDSSVIVALMSEVSDIPVETFTIGFEERAFDERPLARLVAERYGTQHHERTVEPAAFDQSLAQVLHHYDDPFGDSSAIPTGHVSQYAREKVKMVLTGDGGDEVLSGYTIYQGEKFAGQVPTPALLGQKGYCRRTFRRKPSNAGNPRYKFNRARHVCDASERDFESRLISKISRGNERMVKGLLKQVSFDVMPVEDYIHGLMSKCRFRDPFYRLMYFNLKCSLPNDMLVKVDRMSMAHALETRVPFLDHRLVEFMTGIHKDVKMDGYQRKSVLRRSLGHLLPGELLTAPKKGFGVPLREWFKDREFGARLAGLKNTGFGLDSKTVSRVVEETVSGRKDHGNFLWSLLVAERWLSPQTDLIK